MTAREHAQRASELLENIEAAGKRPGRAALPRFPNMPLIEVSLKLAEVHALTAQALLMDREGS